MIHNRGVHITAINQVGGSKFSRIRGANTTRGYGFIVFVIAGDEADGGTSAGRHAETFIQIPIYRWPEPHGVEHHFQLLRTVDLSIVGAITGRKIGGNGGFAISVEAALVWRTGTIMPPVLKVKVVWLTDADMELLSVMLMGRKPNPKSQPIRARPR